MCPYIDRFRPQQLCRARELSIRPYSGAQASGRLFEERYTGGREGRVGGNDRAVCYPRLRSSAQAARPLSMCPHIDGFRSQQNLFRDNAMAREAFRVTEHRACSLSVPKLDLQP